MFDLLQGDCLEVMKSIPNNSVDMVCADLPYGTTACAWDTVIPLDLLWEQYNRICKEDAAMVFTAAQPFTTALAASNLKNFRYEWIWEKPQGTNPLNAKVMPLKSHENILVFYRKRGTYNPQMEQGKPRKGWSSKKTKLGSVYGDRETISRDNPKGMRYPKTVLRFRTERGLHPTQKPVRLMEYLINTYTNEGDTVLDNVMGSGTTGVACKNTGRNFIGIEQDADYFQKAQERILTTNPLIVFF